MDLLIEQPSDRLKEPITTPGLRVGGVSLPSYEEPAPVDSGPMGLREGLDWGDPVQTLFPLAWSGAEQGANFPEMVGRGVADAALALGPGRTAKAIGSKVVEGGAGLAATRAIEAGVGAGGSVASQAAFEGKVDPLAVAAYGAAPFVFPVAGMAASAPSKAVGGAMQATGRAIEQQAPVASAVIGGVGKTISETEAPLVGGVARIAKETPWRKSGQMQAVGNEIGVQTETLAGPFMGPKSRSAQLQREAHLRGDAGVNETVEVAQNKLQRSLKQDIGSINAGANPMGVADAGAMLQQVVPDAKMMAIQQNAATFKKVAKQYPGVTIDPKRINAMFDEVSGVIDDEADLTALGFNTSIFKQAQKTLVEDPSFASLNKLRERVGKIAFAKDKALVGVDDDMAASLKRLYRQLSESMTDAVTALDPKVGSELLESNRNISETMKLAKQLQASIGNEFKSEEGVLASVFNSRKNVTALKKLIPKQHFDSATQAFVQKMARNADDDISYGALSGRLSDKRDVLNVALDPEILLNLRRKTEFGKILSEVYPQTGRDRSVMGLKGAAEANIKGNAAQIATNRAKNTQARGPMAYPTFGATLARGAYPENFRQKEQK
jgi:hypothetical protein